MLPLSVVEIPQNTRCLCAQHKDYIRFSTKSAIMCISLR